MTIKVVITGGPGVGKTRLIEAFQMLGYATVPEAALEIIKKTHDKLRKQGKMEDFQRRVAALQIRNESLIGEGLYFLDRTNIDGIAYSRFYNTAESKKALRFLKTVTYDYVFIPNPLGFSGKRYKNRMEDYETSLKIHEIVRATYREFGYEPITIPVFEFAYVGDEWLRLMMEVMERAKVVLKVIGCIS